MTKLLVFSDIHGNTHNLMHLVPRLHACDKAVFLGDGVGSLEILPRKVQSKIFAVKGNCDFFCPLPDEQLFEIESVKVFVTHGHHYGVKNSQEHIKRRLIESGANLGLYGHTHSFNKTKCSVGDVNFWVVNVGSLGTSRTMQGGTYVEILIDGAEIKEIKNCLLSEL